MEAYKIIHQVQEAFKGLPHKLAAITGKAWQLYYSHASEPKTRNPLSSGNVSPVDHYILYVRQHEAAIKGAGSMLNHRVHAELEYEFLGEVEPECSQKELQQGVLEESFDVLKCLAEQDFSDASDAEMAKIEAECAELRDEASNAVSHLRALRRIKKTNRFKKI